jgi:hypothetical protein
MIKSSTRVIIETTNGGCLEGILDFDYVPSFPVYFCRLGSDDCITIPGWRVKSVTAQEGAAP